MTDDEIKDLIIKGNLNKYTGECPCPYSTSKDPDRGSKPCGDNSAYFKNKEEEKPKCYPEDIQRYEVSDYRSQYDIPVK